MGQQHRLGVLQVGAAGHRPRRGGRGPASASASTRSSDQRRRSVRAWSRRNTLNSVATWSLRLRPGAQPAADLRADLVEQQPLEGAVHVLVGRVRAAASPAAYRSPSASSPRSSSAWSSSVSSPARVQGVGVGAGAGQVVGRQPPVEVRGPRQRLELRRRAAGEAAAPERALVGAACRSISRCPTSMAALSRASSSCRRRAAGLLAIRSAPPAGSAPNRCRARRGPGPRRAAGSA